MSILALLASGGACGREARERPPNVLLVTIDTLRADRLGCYGFGLANTPAIDRLAREGVRVADAISAAPITLPAHASLMTGLYPPAHGVRDNGNYALGPEAETLAKRLHGAGYRTGAFVSAAVLTRRYGLDQGFEAYDDELWAEDEPQLFMIRERPSPRTIDRALGWLERWRREEPTRPFFLWVHLFDPHQPYDIQSVELAAMAPTAYDAEIAQADRGVGRLVEWLERQGELDRTVTVVTADHGESLGEHGEPTHGIFIYDATVRVPLLLRHPAALPGGTTYDGPVRHIDVVPTLLALLGLPGGEATQGVDLLPALQRRAAPPALSQYSEARLAEEGFGMAPLCGLRDRGWKYIQAPRPELYDLRADPRELQDRAAADPGAAAPLDAALETVVTESARRGLQAPTREIDRETEEMLRALGYLAPPEDRAGMAGMDPKDGIVLYAKLQEARQAAQADQWSRARALLEEVLAAAPGNVTAHNVLALAAVRRGDLAEAERQYLVSLAMQPKQHRVVGALGTIALRRNDLAGARRRFEEALALAPTYVEAMGNLGFIAAVEGDEAGARGWYERALALDPSYPHVHRRLADLFYDRGEYDRALENYRSALAVLPGGFELLVQAGNSARYAGDPRAAAEYYAQADRIRPDSWIPPYNTACLQAVTGAPDTALASLGHAVDRGFAVPSLLDGNEDFDGLRPLAGWGALVQRVEEAALRAATGAARPG